MAFSKIWKYCTKEHNNTFLLSLNLLDHNNWTPEKELSCLYAISNHIEKHYQMVRIPKRDGTFRILHIPDPLLKQIQTNILHHILDGMAISPCATAYCRGKDISANVSVHIGKPMVLKLDIENFFDSIDFTMVYRYAFLDIYFPPAVRTLLTNLCSYKNTLPQGAPTSAAISNLVMRSFDDYMSMWCSEREIFYTRYCDDMTFSGDFDAKLVERKVTYFLQAMNFSLNHSKTSLLTQHQRQIVTGIVVNEKPQVSRQYRRKLRQEIHYCLKYGVEAHLKQMGSEQNAADYLASLMGKIQYVLHINPSDTWFRQAKNRIKKIL